MDDVAPVTDSTDSSELVTKVAKVGSFSFVAMVDANILGEIPSGKASTTLNLAVHVYDEASRLRSLEVDLRSKLLI